MIVLYAIWCGFCWLLRGGKFGVIFRALFEREPGTDLGRFFAAFLMVAPLALIDPAYALLWVSLVGGMKLDADPEVESIPASRDARIAMIVARPDYLDREARDAAQVAEAAKE